MSTIPFVINGKISIGFALQGHTAIAECEARLAAQKRNVVVVTQNIDELHFRAGSKNVVELHGIAEYFICK